VVWFHAGDPNLLGYHVYRRLAGSGAFQRVDTDAVVATFFVDSGLSPSTRYDYKVTAMNQSRLESTFSVAATASTNPPQLSGWPLPMPSSTSSSVAIGDIDGDAIPEIVIGDAGVYAWHADGQEVRDGDLNALTWGLLTPETATVTASIALADVNPGTTGLEIVAASWADNRIWIYDAAGNTLPGWPVQPALASLGYWATPTVVDLDGDGLPEILAISKNGQLYGFHADGMPLVGSTGDFGSVGAFSLGSPTVVNLDADPDLEILVAGADSLLHAFNLDGTPLGGNFPVFLGGVAKAAPAVGEIDGIAGTPEIVVTSDNNLVHVFDGTGTPLAGWPKSLSMASASFAPAPALGDLNSDGRD